MEIDDTFFSKIELSIGGPMPWAGVYAVLCCGYNNSDGPYMRLTHRVLYIGSSKNVRDRLMNPNHHYRRLYSKLTDWSICTKHYYCENYVELEKQLIKIYKPVLNKHGK